MKATQHWGDFVLEFFFDTSKLWNVKTQIAKESWSLKKWFERANHVWFTSLTQHG